MPSGEGLQQPFQGSRRQVAAQHQPQPGRALWHRGWTDRHAQQALDLQMALQFEAPLIVAHEQGQDRTASRQRRPARRCKGRPPAQATLQQPGPKVGALLQQIKGGQGCRRQGRGQGGGVTEGAGALQQPVAEQIAAGQEGTAAAEGLAEGTAHQMHPLQPMGQAAPAGAQQAQGMGLIDQQQGRMALAKGRQRRQIGAAALHAEQALAEHHQAPLAGGGPDLGQVPLQIGQVVVGEAAQLGAGGLHPHQQGVVDQPVGEHQAMAIGQGRYRSDVGLEAAGKEQHPLAPQPGGQPRLELPVHRPAAAHQARGPRPHPIAADGGAGGLLQGRVLAQAQVVIAGQIKQRAGTGPLRPQAPRRGGLERTQHAPAADRQALQGAAQGIEGVGGQGMEQGPGWAQSGQ